MSETTTYTRDALDGMSRVELRTIAVKVLGMDNKECSNFNSEPLKDWIMEKQGENAKGNGKSSASSAAKATGKGRASKATTSKAASKERQSQAEDTSGSSSIDVSEVIGRIDALGKTVDEDIKEELEGIKATLSSIERSQVMIYGLLEDVYKIHYEPDDLAARLSELEEEFSNDQGNE